MLRGAGHNRGHSRRTKDPKLLNRKHTLSNSQSSNLGSIPGSATNLSISAIHSLTATLPIATIWLVLVFVLTK